MMLCFTFILNCPALSHVRSVVKLLNNYSDMRNCISNNKNTSVIIHVLYNI